ncbi:MAG: divalent-cation tolerance protein CutA [Dehalococcoidia bacterium]
MSAEKHIVVFITTETQAQGQEIADALLADKLAACVNIVPEVHSRFWWQGKIDSADESLLIVKTKASLLDDVVALVKSRHSYSVPEIIALPIIGGNKDYLDWIDESTCK